MTSNKPRQNSVKSQVFDKDRFTQSDQPQEAPVNGSETDTPVLVELAQASQDKNLVTFTPGRAMQETMSVWRIDIPSGDCWATDRINKKNFPVPIAELYAGGYRLFGIFGISGNTGWAYLTNWVEVE